MTLKQWLKKAHELRTAHHAAETQFYLFLLDSEKDEKIPWRGAFGSFAELLKNECLVDVGRYQTFCDALPKVGVEKAQEIGVSGTIAAGRVQDEPMRATSVEALQEWTRAKGHPPSLEAAKAVVNNIAPITRMPRDLAAKLKNDDLAKENAALRKQVAVLERENAALKRKLAAHGGSKAA